jgi:hypothetical protein
MDERNLASIFRSNAGFQCRISTLGRSLCQTSQKRGIGNAKNLQRDIGGGTPAATLKHCFKNKLHDSFVYGTPQPTELVWNGKSPSYLNKLGVNFFEK